MRTITRSQWLMVITLLGCAYHPLQVSAETSERQSGLNSADFFAIPPVDSQNLAISRGGTEVTLNDLKSNGVVSSNQASNLVTGSNWVTEGSFAGATGFATVVQNSGSNVLIQNATIINLQVK
jgi:hypothetical protein